jgi:hypothetical protein
MPNCYGSRSPGHRHVPTAGKKDYFLLLACRIQTTPPHFIDGGDLRPKQPCNPNPSAATVLTAAAAVL